MRQITCQTLALLIVSLTILLGGCADSDEKKGQALLTQAEALLEQGREAAAEAVLTDLLAQYPSSQAATKGRQEMQSIMASREERAKQKLITQKLTKIVDSYRQVLDGYRAMYSEYPRSIASLDESDYFFDSSYLEEITPADFQVYLFLQEDGSGYRLWSVNADSARGYRVDAAGKQMLAFDTVETLAELKTRYNADAWDQKLVALLQL